MPSRSGAGGDEWQRDGSYSLAQLYVAAKAAEDALDTIAELRRAHVEPPAVERHIVLGNIEEDYHTLGRRMVATFLRVDGWTVHDLGNDVPAADFVDTAEAQHARVIGVSAMMESTALNIRRLRAEIDRRELRDRVKLAVGGAVFTVVPSLVDGVGGDGSATNALGAAALCENLRLQTLRGGDKL